MLKNIAEVTNKDGLKFSADEFSRAFTVTVSTDFGDVAEVIFEVEDNILKYQDVLLYKDVYDKDKMEDTAIELFHNIDYNNVQDITEVVNQFANSDCWQSNKRTVKRRP